MSVFANFICSRERLGDILFSSQNGVVDG